MSEVKQCTCQAPKVNMPIPDGFEGTVICAKCGGIATLPRKKSEYKGTDPIEGYLFDVNANAPGMTMEKAQLVMLMRIEAAILSQGQAKKTKDSEKAK